MTDDRININQVASLVPTRFRTINQAMYDRGKYDARNMGLRDRALPLLYLEGFKPDEQLCYRAGWFDQIVGDDDNRRILSHTIDC